MTFPRVVWEKLIFFSSLIWPASISSYLFSFSLPARSQRFSFERNILPCSTLSNLIWKIVCDRELLWFIRVARVVRLVSPIYIKFRASHWFSTRYSDSPSTWIPKILSSLTYSYRFIYSSARRSKTRSLYTYIKLQVMVDPGTRC